MRKREKKFEVFFCHNWVEHTVETLDTLIDELDTQGHEESNSWS